MAKKFYLTSKDKAGLKKLIQQAGAGGGKLSRRPVPQRRRTRGSGGGGGGETSTFVGKTTATIPARVDDDTPGEGDSSDVDIKEGSIVGSLHNWSNIEIGTGYFISGFECDGNTIVNDIWC
jgi:hypothetical protein